MNAFSMVRLSVVALTLALAIGARAQVVAYQISATFTQVTYGRSSSLYGVTAAPYDFTGTITLDLSLNTVTNHLETGDLYSDGHALTHNLYGFSASAVTGLNFQFGTQTWSAAHLLENTVGGLTATVFADTDLTTTPARFFMQVQGLPGAAPNTAILRIGGFSVGESTAELDMDFTLNSRVGLATGYAFAPSGTVAAVSAVPEASTYALMAGLGALGVAVWRRRGGERTA